MTIIWVIFALLTGAAVFSVLWPLSRAPEPVDSRELDVAFYKAQAAEIARDTERGVLGAEEAEAAGAEAARRLMSAAQRDTQKDVVLGSTWAPRIVAIVAIVFVPACALGVYWQVGAPNMPDEPLQARLDAPPASMDMAAAIARIEQHLAKHPEDGQGWAVVAPIYLRLQRYDDAQRAFNNVIRTLGPTADRFAALGEAQMQMAGGTINAEAKRSFEEASKRDAKSPRARFYLGLAAEQDGDKPKAVALWREIVADSPPDAPWLPTVKNHISVATGEATGPKAGDALRGKTADAVAAMPKDQQQAMIHRMVDGLAQRLKVNGSDVEGWLRLVRAYRVLNEGDKAKVALADARLALAADASAKKRLDELAHELGLES